MSKLTKENLIDRVLIDENGCWIWQGAIKKARNRALTYGWVTYNNKQMNAHRAAWLVVNGEIPEGKFVCHKCDVPRCVNPNHLFLGTPSDNMKDMWDKKRHSLPTEGVIGSRSSKINLITVKRIRELLQQGQKQRDIAKIFGLSQAAISQINTGRNWSRYV